MEPRHLIETVEVTISEVPFDEAVAWMSQEYCWGDTRRCVHAVNYMLKHAPGATLKESWDFIHPLANEWFYGELKNSFMPG